ncbi:unnamed protein product [Aureobasidium mustum]|uniref:RRM domain-containing protein n=1 Tax=Aureobasidium mustum TaxID=2773714 RepID=A0A9N8JEE5_9PEZI|nr:unnamed protein product [Aureobasidium mustum]
MADQRPKRYSPPASRMSALPNFGSLSPIGQANGTKTLSIFTSPDSLPGLSPTMERRTDHRNSEPLETQARWMIRIRRLPRNFTHDALRSMLLFATDLEDTKLLSSSEHTSLEDSNFSSALAIFSSEAGAMEAKKHLHGKSMEKGVTTMIVELIPNSQPAYNGSRRNTVDGTALRQQNTSGGSNSTTLSENPLSRQSSRFTNSFHQNLGSQAQQSMNSQSITSPLTSPMISTAHAYEFPAPDSSNRLQGLFSPQSPVANAYSDHNRISGKSLINDGNDDDETGELLKDPVGYAQNGPKPSSSYSSFVPQFGSLSLETSASTTNGHSYPTYVGSPSASTYSSPQTVRSPTLPTPTRGPAGGPNGTYSNRNLKHDYPPANPADQNPPCNTLYVGNLPLNTSEDELKSLFSKSRGFKRLCFRTKQNGPMCFVEFEDTSYASHALHELYGVQLHNSYKGGIRVSFSKNPLGVRSDNRNHAAMGSHPGQSGFSNGMGAPPGFTTAAGPPPGLMPPGVHGQQSHAPPPVQNNAARGYPPQYRGINPQSYSQQGTNGYSQSHRNLSSGQYTYPPTFGSMNSFMDHSLNGNIYTNGNGQNALNGHNGR